MNRRAVTRGQESTRRSARRATGRSRLPARARSRATEARRAHRPSPSPIACRVMRLSPWLDPRSCGGANRSMPIARHAAAGSLVQRRAPHGAETDDDDVRGVMRWHESGRPRPRTRGQDIAHAAGLHCAHAHRPPLWPRDTHAPADAHHGGRRRCGRRAGADDQSRALPAVRAVGDAVLRPRHRSHEARGRDGHAEPVQDLVFALALEAGHLHGGRSAALQGFRHQRLSHRRGPGRPGSIPHHAAVRRAVERLHRRARRST